MTAISRAKVIVYGLVPPQLAALGVTLRRSPEPGARPRTPRPDP